MKLNTNIEDLKGMNNKEIAKQLKKELKVQFKGVKFSVTSSIYSIDCSCSDEDFEINKEGIKEVAGMFTKYTTDTININYKIASYCDTQEYKEQREKEYKAQQAELEKERQERENLYDNNVTIEALKMDDIKIVNVENKDIFVTALEPGCNKNNWKIDNDKYIDEESCLNKYKITDIIYMSKVNYDYFCFNLLNDYDFLTNKGGSCLDNETENVLYNYAICVYCKGKEPLIIDPQGYSYARYTNKLAEDINGDLQKEFDAKLTVDNSSYLETFNNISIADLYIYAKGTWSYLEKKIINDDRFIYDDYTSNVIITGLTYKELLKDGGTKLNLEKLCHSNELLAENIIKCETGMAQILFNKSKLETTFKGIKFSERLSKELQRVTDHKPTPEPPKPTKKQINHNSSNIKQDENNIIVVDFTPKQTINAKWEEEPATSKQLYALHCITKIKTTELKISKGKASKLIGEAKKGKNIKAKLKELIDIQNINQSII